MFESIPKNAFATMEVILGILVLASICRIVLGLCNARVDHQELKLRIRSWWWMMGLLFSSLVLSENWATVFFAFLSFLALKEFLSIVPTRNADRRVVFWAYLAIPVQYYLVAMEWYGMFIIFVPVYIFLFLPMRMVIAGQTSGFIRSAGTIHWAVMLTVFALSHVAFLLKLPTVHQDGGSIGLVLFLILVTEANDVLQYIWGKSLGKHKIIPKVSPNKTWEGFLGSLGTVTIVSALLAPVLTPFSYTSGMLIGALISTFGFFGDVVVSALKRDLQIKDTGTLIPGHGGILDRLDSLIYTAPVFFHVTRYFTT